jgi:hypothetical protein
MSAGRWCKADRARRRPKVGDLAELGMGLGYVERGKRDGEGSRTCTTMFIHRCLMLCLSTQTALRVRIISLARQQIFRMIFWPKFWVRRSSLAIEQVAADFAKLEKWDV